MSGSPAPERAAPGMAVRLRRAAKASFRHVSWQHPLVRAVLPVVDAADRLVRAPSADLRRLPPYSVRVRSRGVHGQFGGRSTAASSERFVRFMVERAGLRPDSRVLDVGCGCGLTALAFADHLDRGHYTGIDIDRPSVAACRANPSLARFEFIDADIDGDMFGDDTAAAGYRFPFTDARFSHVIMCSVVTHLLPPEVGNYLAESGRVLEPGGTLVFSTFLTDHGPGRGLYAFPHDRGDHRLAQEDLPGKGVAYPLAHLDGALARAGLARRRDPVIGSWREDPAVAPTDPLASVQDLVVAVRG